MNKQEQQEYERILKQNKELQTENIKLRQIIKEINNAIGKIPTVDIVGITIDIKAKCKEVF